MRGHLDQWLTETIFSALLETNTAIPAKIIEFNCGENTVKVQISIKRKSVLKSPHYGEEEAQQETTEILEDVPVHLMRTGNYADTIPIESGDRCMLVFQQSNINCWWAKGHQQDAVGSIDTRRHHLSDAVALIGLWPQQESVKEWNNEWFERRTLDNETRVAIKKGDGAWIQDMISDLRLSRNGFDVWVDNQSFLDALIQGFTACSEGFVADGVGFAALATESTLTNIAAYVATAAVDEAVAETCLEVVSLIETIKGSVLVPEPQVCMEEIEVLDCPEGC